MTARDLRRYAMAVVLLAGPSLGACSPIQNAAAPAGHWLRDAHSGCQFWTAERAFVSGSWTGPCLDGRADGPGVAIMETVPDRAGQPPTFTATVRGEFREGKADGLIFTFYSPGVTVIATYEDGLQKGDLVAHLLGFGEDAWVTGPMGPRIDPQSVMGGGEFLNPARLRPLFPGTRPWDWQQHTSAAIRFNELFDFRKYDTIEAARAAIDRALPAGRKSDDLLSALDSSGPTHNNADLVALYYDLPARSYCKHSVTLARYPNLTWYCILSVRYDAANDNADRWSFVAVFDDAGTLQATEVRRYFEGKHFRARHVPLKAEDFASTEDFIAAALDVLGPTPTRKAVTRLMENSGLKLGHAAKSDTLEYAGAGSGITIAVTGCEMSIDVLWHFDPATGRLKDVQQSPFRGCL